MKEYGLFIDGRFEAAQGGKTVPTLNPATDESWATVAAASREDVERAVGAARRAHGSGVWRGKSRAERAAVLGTAAGLVFDRAEELALAEVRDSGWTMRMASMAAVTSAGQQFLYYSELLGSTTDEEELTESVPVASRNLVRREPYGVCACITPYNFSLAGAAWKLAPALAAGNTVVLKPSPHTPVTALLLAEICQQAGVPDGVVNVVTGPGAELGEALVTHPDVAKVAFTGSTQVGRRIMEVASRSLKKLTLELGGKSPFIVLDDADLDCAVRGALFGIFFNCGQACEAGTRVLVHRSLHDRFVEHLVEVARTIKLGDTEDMATDMGPLISSGQLASTQRYVAMGKAEGAECVLGGGRPTELAKGYYHEPTIFVGVRSDMRIAQEEIFGPVVSILPFADDEEAIHIANDTIYGLAASVWSRNVARARAMADSIEAGTVWINDHHLINVRFPFGGYKQSGIGRELGPHGLAEYQQVKHIHVGEPAPAAEKSYFGILLGG